MAMGTCRQRHSGKRSFGTAGGWREAPGDPFYRQLNELLDHAGFDGVCEERRHRLYQSTRRAAFAAVPRHPADLLVAPHTFASVHSTKLLHEIR
jgi:hypothetical protein